VTAIGEPGAVPAAVRTTSAGAIAPTRPAPELREFLVSLDALAIVVAWCLAWLARWDGAPPAGAVEVVVGLGGVTALALVLIAALGLYRARVCAVRAVELVRLARAAGLAAGAVFLASRMFSVEVSSYRITAGFAISFGLLAGFRALYAGWLQAVRADGRLGRPVVIVGTNDEALELYRLLHAHPELGFRINGVVGDETAVVEWGTGVPWLGRTDTTLEALRASGATGVFVAPSALEPGQLNPLCRELVGAGVHVHLSSGLHGIAQRRLRPMPVAHEPCFYLEPVGLARRQQIAKRALDVALGSLALLVTLPLLALAALAIKFEDRGPVLFRQRRVGRDGVPFDVIKLRTMVVDAEARRAPLETSNERGGPLFKVATDPRRTRIGRLLERSSFDEVPQLWNVLRGEMSLVGPRPALPSEVESFDEKLLGRDSVPPGLTGLWQVTARDNPSFYAYRRLDLFYLENWSIGLDLTIMLGTARALVARLFRSSTSGPVPTSG